MAKGSGTRWKAIILVADDNPRYVELVRANVYASGYRVSTATDGAAASKVAETQNPDLVILDFMMPVIDGYEVCHGIREFSLVPIIMLTARGERSPRRLRDCCWAPANACRTISAQRNSSLG